MDEFYLYLILWLITGFACYLIGFVMGYGAARKTARN